MIKYITREEFNQLVKDGTLDQYVGHIVEEHPQTNCLNYMDSEYKDEIRIFILDEANPVKKKVA